MAEGDFAYRAAPSALGFMARAFLPSPGLGEGEAVPRLEERWRGLVFHREQVEALARATGIEPAAVLTPLLPHVLGFRLQMALLTRRAFPLPIWGALQVRNRFTQRRALVVGEGYELATRVGPTRRVAKGLEVDLVSELSLGGAVAWVGEVTYFYRGRFGAAGEVAGPVAPTLHQAPRVEELVLPVGGGWTFGGLTGDYNGIHLWSAYARRFGFPRAFPHPQRVAAACLGRLVAPAGEEQVLELWLKGPAFYGATAQLRSAPWDGGVELGLWLSGEDRPALLGRWRAA